MKAAMYYGNKDIRVEDIPEPAVRPGTVKVRIEWCGICGTDLHEYLDGPIFAPAAGSPHPLTGETADSGGGRRAPTRRCADPSPTEPGISGTKTRL